MAATLARVSGAASIASTVSTAITFARVGVNAVMGSAAEPITALQMDKIVQHPFVVALTMGFLWDMQESEPKAKLLFEGHSVVIQKDTLKTISDRIDKVAGRDDLELLEPVTRAFLHMYPPTTVQLQTFHRRLCLGLLHQSKLYADQPNGKTTAKLLDKIHDEVDTACKDWGAQITKGNAEESREAILTGLLMDTERVLKESVQKELSNLEGNIKTNAEQIAKINEQNQKVKEPLASVIQALTEQNKINEARKVELIAELKALHAKMHIQTEKLKKIPPGLIESYLKEMQSIFNPSVIENLYKSFCGAEVTNFAPVAHYENPAEKGSGIPEFDLTKFLNPKNEKYVDVNGEGDRKHINSGSAAAPAPAPAQVTEPVRGFRKLKIGEIGVLQAMLGPRIEEFIVIHNRFIKAIAQYDVYKK